MNEPIHIISLGAGVQSSTMALMAAKGEITPMPTAAIFADTQDEPVEVYEWLKYLAPFLPFPIITVTAGKLGERLFADKKGNYIPIPAYGSNGGIDSRVCTDRFKLSPIRRKAKELLGLSGKSVRSKTPLVVMWIGISTDEVSRAKDSRLRWIQNRFPLLMEHRMNRQDCINWMKSNGFNDAPKSACEFCPYRSNAAWRAMQINPERWQRILGIDRRLTLERGQYLHSSRRPLESIDLTTEEERGQINMFNNECMGLCGV